MSGVRGFARRAAWSAAVRLGLQVYEPSPENLPRLDELTEYVEDPRPVSDDRATTATDELPDLTSLPDALGQVLESTASVGYAMLEVGPKYGVHARWIDTKLEPSELVFSDFASDQHLHAKWVDALRSPHRFVYGDLREARELLELEQFDLVLFLGVLYHSIHHFRSSAMLNRVTRAGRDDARRDDRRLPSRRGRTPTVASRDREGESDSLTQAVRLELAWTGWRKVRRFTGYRPGTSEALFLCDKTDELREGADLTDVVTPHRAR